MFFCILTLLLFQSRVVVFSRQPQKAVAVSTCASHYWLKLLATQRGNTEQLLETKHCTPPSRGAHCVCLKPAHCLPPVYSQAKTLLGACYSDTLGTNLFLPGGKGILDWDWNWKVLLKNPVRKWKKKKEASNSSTLNSSFHLFQTSQFLSMYIFCLFVYGLIHTHCHQVLFLVPKATNP